MSQPKENEFDERIEIAPGIWYGGTEKFTAEKIEDRMRLLSMPPEEAQKLVNMTLYPQYWDVRPEDLSKWDESIPTRYSEYDDEGETDI